MKLTHLVLLASTAFLTVASAQDLKSFEVKLTGSKLLYGVLKISLSIENKNDFGIADIKMVCEAIAESGTSVASYPLTIFQNFPARNSKAVKDFQIGIWPDQAKTLECRATGARRGG